MNLHEYQAKRLLANFGLDMPLGICIEDNTPDSIAEALEFFKTHEKIVVKAQIHAGGRGKGVFVENGQHGVQVVPLNQARQAIASMFGNILVTKQTGPEGRRVRKVYLTEAISVEKEFYVSILIDRTQQCPVLVASSEGGCEIEDVAQKSPEAILKLPIDPLLGLRPFQARKVCYLFGLTGELAQRCVQTLLKLYQAFTKMDASLVEINPLVSTKDGRICLLDAKVQLDDNALFRHPEYNECICLLLLYWTLRRL